MAEGNKLTVKLGLDTSVLSKQLRILSEALARCEELERDKLTLDIAIDHYTGSEPQA